MDNFNYLRIHIWETLTLALFIRPIRISNILVDTLENDLLVTFTLLDAAPQTGPVEDPLQEASLGKLIQRLDRAINSEELTFRVKYNTRQANLHARAQSLNVKYEINETKEKKENKQKVSGGTKAAIWIGFILGGAGIGALIGFFVLQKLANK
jgi:hypothetical protein